ncbi:MAG: DUF2321 domain-containing protein [Fretibacterium sp.]|nr:DUF2321 domain-containing protein [Fretibacterium sp.]
MYGTSGMKYEMTAVVCENGHLISGDWSDFRLNPKEYCPECGAKLITNCPHCNAIIPGNICTEHKHYDYYEEEEKIEIICTHRATQREIPAFCGKCGKPYPWAKKSMENSRIGFE